MQVENDEEPEEDVPVLAAVAQSVEARHAIPIIGDRLAIDQARGSFEGERSARDQWKAAGPVVPVAGEQPQPRRVAAHQHSEAVVFDLVQPPSPSGRFRGWAGQAGLAEVGQGYATQQHGV